MSSVISTVADMLVTIFAQCILESHTMLSLWKCFECDLHNYPLYHLCQACFNKCPHQLSPVDRILSQQKLLFDGYLRMEIINNLSTKIISQDIINLCYQFYFVTIDIETITKKDFYSKEYQKLLYKLAKQYMAGGKYFISLQLFTTLAKSTAELDKLQYYSTRRIAEIYDYFRDLEKQEHAYKSSIILIENSSDPALKDKNPPYFAYGRVLQSQGKYLVAIEQFTKMAKEAIHFARIGRCYSKLKHYEDADKFYLKAIKMDSNEELVRCWYGASLLDREQYKKALKQFKIALEINPESRHYEYYRNRCIECYRGLKDFKNMEKLFSEAIEKATDLNSKCSAYYEIAEFYKDRVDDYDKASRYYSECLKIDNEYKYANSGYAFVLYQKGDVEKALEYVNIQLRISDPCMYYAFNYGYFNHLLGNKEEAEKGMKEALELIETVEHRNKMLKSLYVKETDEQSLEFLVRFKRELQNKFE